MGLVDDGRIVVAALLEEFDDMKAGGAAQDP